MKRPLGGADWDIILGYTCRVRVIHLFDACGVTADCVEELSSPPTSTVSIFPKLSELSIFRLGKKIIPFLQHLTGPRLTDLKLNHPYEVEDAISTFGEKCPNITTFEYRPSAATENPNMLSRLISQWPNLRSMYCQYARSLNAVARTHLSHIHNLHSLKLELLDEMVDLSSPSILTFPALLHCELHARSLDTIRRFFDPCRLSVIEQLNFELLILPAEPELQSFLAALTDACNHDSLSGFKLGIPIYVDPVPPYHINFHHLCPLTVFTNIQSIDLTIPWAMDLSEQEILHLTSSWPRLEVLILGGNGVMHRTTLGGITPGGFVRLLEQCRSLSRFSFTFDTGGYTDIPQGHPWHGLDMPEDTEICVHHSAIEEESVEALGTFFHAAPFPKFKLVFGNGREDGRLYREPLNLYWDRWKRVHSLAQNLWEERETSFHSLSQGQSAVHSDGHGSDSSDTGVN